eukprot:SAG31_NODE_2050_length_6560_cov_2.712119_4_plen_135_part_00
MLLSRFCGAFLVFIRLIEKYGTDRESVTLQVLPELQQRNGQVVGYSLVAPFECLQPFLSTCAGLLSTGAQSGAGGVRMVPAAASADHGESHDLITLAPPHTVLPIPRSAGLFGKGAVDKAGKVCFVFFLIFAAA